MTALVAKYGHKVFVFEDDRVELRRDLCPEYAASHRGRNGSAVA